MAAGHRAIVRDRMYLRQVPRPRVFRDRSNPLEDLREEEIFARYRFRPDTIYFIVDLCQAAARDTGRCFAIPLVLCVLSYLRFLATGAFQLTVGDTVNLSQPTVNRVCRQVGQVISALADRYICFPSGDRVRQVKQQFGAMAGFSNVVGVIDCTHVSIKKPSSNPEDYIGSIIEITNIKLCIFQAVCDASYRITSAVVMWPGRTHDARIWRQCALRRRFEDGDMQGFLLADSGYACTRYMLTPYMNPVGEAQARYNGALCRTRVTVKQTFGILKQRFQVFRRKLNCSPERACMHIRNCITLHNLAIDRRDIVAVDPIDPNDYHGVDVGDNMDGKAAREYVTRMYFER
ncbi:putative nuclease HARBI1 [Mya arenaria]|uniref:putative nuclease HARBI1 n=1 Tax=Mya arenaria TaxID=6604 RepID=UPI0022E97CD2|nr:putative nuclease HARBI1 [Mya arenaria]